MKSGDIVRIGDVEGRDYIIGLRSTEMKKLNPRYYPLKPFFSMESESATVNPKMGNFSYTDYISDSGLLKTPTQLGITFDITKEVKEEVVVDITMDENIEMNDDSSYGGKSKKMAIVDS